jgi:hypothetical protein
MSSSLHHSIIPESMEMYLLGHTANKAYDVESFGSQPSKVLNRFDHKVFQAGEFYSKPDDIVSCFLRLKKAFNTHVTASCRLLHVAKLPCEASARTA